MKQSLDSLAALCEPGHLRLAYEEAIENVRVPADANEEWPQGFLQQLSHDLQVGNVHPHHASVRSSSQEPLGAEEMTRLRDQVVQCAIKSLLQRSLRLDPTSTPPEEAIKWIVCVVNRGLTRGFATEIRKPVDIRNREHFAHAASQRIDNEHVRRLFESYVSQSSSEPEGPLSSMACCLAFAGIDRLLEEAKAIACGDGVVHVEGARFSSQIIVLVDPDPNYDWILPAIDKRLQDELLNLKLAIDPTKTQRFDLARGDKLLFLGYQLTYSLGQDGVRRACYEDVRKQESAKAKPLTVAMKRTSKQPPLSSRLRKFWPALGPWGWAFVLVLGGFLLANLGWLYVYLSAEKDPLRYEHFVRPSGDRVQYTVCLPRGYDRSRHYPLIVFLHVPGKEGGTGDKLRFPGISLAIDLARERGEPFNFIVLFPGGAQGNWEFGSDESALAIEIADEACRKFSVDPDRVYLTGTANGRQGVWNLAAEYSDRWAAIVPLTALRGRIAASRLADIPCWCFHSGTNRLDQARARMRELEEAGARPRLTIVPGDGTVWNQAYLNRDLYGWLSEQRRRNR